MKIQSKPLSWFQCKHTNDRLASGPKILVYLDDVSISNSKVIARVRVRVRVMSVTAMTFLFCPTWCSLIA